MSMTFNNSAEWRQLQRMTFRPTAAPAPLKSTLWENLVSFSSLLAIIGTIAYLLVR